MLLRDLLNSARLVVRHTGDVFTTDTHARVRLIPVYATILLAGEGAQVSRMDFCVAGGPYTPCPLTSSAEH